MSPVNGQVMTASGRYFNLSCEARGVPPPKITWFKGEIKIISNSPLNDDKDTASALAFNSVRLENRGSYCCEANSAEGWVKSSSIFLTGIKIESRWRNLRTFALIVSAYPYCASNSCCNVTPRHASSARAKETFLQRIGLVAVSLSWR